MEEQAVWDMTPYFPSFNGPEYQAFDQEHLKALEGLEAKIEALEPLCGDNVAVWADILLSWEQAVARTSHLMSYLGCLGAADTKDDGVQDALAQFAGRRGTMMRFDAVMCNGLRECSDEAFKALCDVPELEGMAYHLEKLRARASKRMSMEMEALTADLMVDGFGAWGRLYSKVDGALRFELAPEGQPAQQVPMAWKRSLTQSPDPAVRRAALEGSNKAWESMGHVVAASLNAIAGVRLTLYKWRGVDHFLDMACEDSAIDRETLDAMMGAVVKKQEVARRYLRLKAELLGVERLGFQDEACPLPLGEPIKVDWSEARRRVELAFERYNPELGAFARHAFENRWIDAEPRDNKRSGGFCSSSMWLGQSRIFMTYNDTLGDLQTLAHELGHAFHGRVLRDSRPVARMYPMTLAESASMFAEEVMTTAFLEDPNTSPRDRAVLLDTRMKRASSSLLNIPMRYFFEKSFYEERAKGEVSIGRLKELMLAAQRQSYGDALDESQLDPWFWASKLHFYITRVSFYNFPYTFGHLFSHAIFMRATQEGPQFWETYKELLRRTGSASPETIAQDLLGVSLRDEGFWLSSMASFDDDMEQFEAAVRHPEVGLSAH